MSYFLFRNINRLSCYKFSPPLLLKHKHPDFKMPLCLTTKQLTFVRHFSYTGFYSTLSQSAPVVSFQTLLLDFHQYTGLPWWAVIMLTTLGIRSFIVFPLTVHQHQVLSRLVNINAGLGEIATQLNKEVNIARRMYSWTEEQSKLVYRRQMKKVYQDSVVRENCHPFKATLLVLIQVPVWICFSVSLRNLTMTSSLVDPGFNLLQTSFKTEGLLWFSDLTCPDPIILPLLLLLVNGSLIEIHAMKKIGKSSLFQKVLLNGTRIVTVVVAVAASMNPASVSFYWLCSSSIGLAQNLLLMAPRVRSVLRIPKTSHETLTPFSDLATNFKKRFKM